MIYYSKTKPRQNMSLTEAKRDILPVLTQLSLGSGSGKLTGQDILFALPCLRKPTSSTRGLDAFVSDLVHAKYLRNFM
jgi:hypothetical protein